MSFHSMGGNVGDAVAPLVVGALLTVFSWRDVVLMNVIPGIVMSALILVYIGRLYNAEKAAGVAAKKLAPMTGAERLRSIAALLTDRAVVTLSIGSTFRTMTQSALLTFLPVYLARDMGYSPLWIGACMFALQAAGFIAAPIAGHLSDTIGRRQIVASSMSMTAVVLLAMIFAGGTIWFVLLVAVLGFFLFAVRAVLQAWLLDATPPGLGGSAIGILFGAQAAGAAIGPICAGILADHYGIMAAFYFLAGTIIVANLMIFVTPAGVAKTHSSGRPNPPARRGPRRDVLLDHAQQRRQRDAEQAERHDRHEHLVDLERRRGPHDQIADAGDRGVEIGQHHADHAAADREPDAGDDERQRAGQHDVGPQLPLRAAERAPDFEQLGVDRLHALIGVDDHREEREQEQDDDLGGGLVAGPQHDQRHERDRRDRIEEGDVDGEADVENVEARQRQAEQRAEDDGKRQPHHQHEQARPEPGPQLAACDHADRRDRDLRTAW